MKRIYIDVEDNMVERCWHEDGEELEIVVVQALSREDWESTRKAFEGVSNHELKDGFGRAGAEDVWVYTLKTCPIDRRYRKDVLDVIK